MTEGDTSNITRAGNTPIHSSLSLSSYHTKTDRSSLETSGSASLSGSSNLTASSSSSFTGSLRSCRSDERSISYWGSEGHGTLYDMYALSPTLQSPYNVSSPLRSPPESPLIANTAYTATKLSNRLSMYLASLPRSAQGGVSPLSQDAGDATRFTSISSYIHPPSPYADTQTDNFYTEYSGLKSPSYANLAVTEGFGRDFDSRATPLSLLGYGGPPHIGGVTPPLSPLYASRW